MAKTPPAAKTTKKAAAKKTPVKRSAPEKSAAKQTDSDSRTLNIKYADKSAGQPEMAALFLDIVQTLRPYDKKGSMKLHQNTGGQAILVSHKPVEIAGRKKPELWFAGALVQKGYVGFYYMPVYGEPGIRKHFTPEFIKCLKGQCCFHIKKKDPVVMNDIKKALKIGFDAWKDRGWL